MVLLPETFLRGKLLFFPGHSILSWIVMVVMDTLIVVVINCCGTIDEDTNRRHRRHLYPCPRWCCTGQVLSDWESLQYTVGNQRKVKIEHCALTVFILLRKVLKIARKNELPAKNELAAQNNWLQKIIACKKVACKKINCLQKKYLPAKKI